MRRPTRRAGWLAAALALLSVSLGAHTDAPGRALRLQLRGAVLEGLLEIDLPAGPLAAVPIGQAPGEGQGADPEQALGLRAAAAGLRGLSLGVGSGAPDAPAPVLKTPELLEARGRRTRLGGLEGRLLLRAPGPREGEVLVIAVEAGLPLTVELFAGTGAVLELRAGLGKELDGGLSLSPRPGAPVVVHVRRAGPARAPSAPGAPGTPR